jgi:hypothetical protein
VTTNQVFEKCFVHVLSGSSATLVKITVSKSAFSVYCDDGLMVKSVVNSSICVNLVELVQICSVQMSWILYASRSKFFVLCCIIKLILSPINFPTLLVPFHLQQHQRQMPPPMLVSSYQQYQQHLHHAHQLYQRITQTITRGAADTTGI